MHMVQWMHRIKNDVWKMAILEISHGKKYQILLTNEQVHRVYNTIIQFS